MGEPFEIKKIDLHDKESRADPGFKLASPMGKVPAINDGAVNMADSAAIALYLADRYPAAGLAPPIEDPARGQYLYWMTYTPGVMEPAMAERFNGWEVNPGSSGWGNFDLMISTLEKGLGDGPWLLGRRFSAADVLVGSTINFIKIFGIMPDSEILAGYLQRCLARAAYARALAREPVDN
jgi:glutathione S-transferase